MDTMASVHYPQTFQEQQRALCMLSEFITEKESWLDGVLDQLEWTREGITSRPVMVQCPNNEHHFVPETSLEKHLEKCRYSSHGVSPADLERFKETLQYDYDGITNVTKVTIDPSVESAVSQYIDQKQKQPGLLPLMPLPMAEPATLSHVGHTSSEPPLVSLVDAADPPQEMVDSTDPVHLIRYIKSWRLVPKCHSVLSPPLNQVALKGWLFCNIPEDHAHCGVMGGEIQAVEHIVHSLSSPPLSPDVVVEKLHPLLHSKTRAFVLKLWKFLAISRIQQESSIPDSTVEELLPLPVAKSSTVDQQLGTGLVAEIQALAASGPAHANHTPDLPLPTECVQVKRTPEERRVLYDYVVEVSKEKLGQTKNYLNDPSLFRDDTKILRAQAKAQLQAAEDKKSHWEIMKEMRDYKRRRQKYRAKNVHITQKSIKDTFRDLIDLRMEEIRAAARLEAGTAVGEEDENEQAGAEKNERDTDISHSRRSSREVSPSATHQSRTSSRRRESQSRTGERRHPRSRSRERQSEQSQDRQTSLSTREKSSHDSHRRKRSRSQERDNSQSKSRERRKRSRSRSREKTNGSQSWSKERRNKSRSKSRERKEKSSRSEKHSHHKHKSKRKH